MPFAKGDRVRHSGKPEWGIGEVLENSSAAKVRVFFVGAGDKQLSLTHVSLVPVTGPDAHHPVLDHLKLVPSAKGVSYISLPQSVLYK